MGVQVPPLSCGNAQMRRPVSLQPGKSACNLRAIGGCTVAPSGRLRWLRILGRAGRGRPAGPAAGAHTDPEGALAAHRHDAAARLVRLFRLVRRSSHKRTELPGDRTVALLRGVLVAEGDGGCRMPEASHDLADRGPAGRGLEAPEPRKLWKCSPLILAPAQAAAHSGRNL